MLVACIALQSYFDRAEGAACYALFTILENLHIFQCRETLTG